MTEQEEQEELYEELEKCTNEHERKIILAAIRATTEAYLDHIRDSGCQEP
jgi:hypothetical protein